MEQDVLEIRIAVMAVGAPAGGAQINFHVATAGRVTADLQNGPAKIRPSLEVRKPGMNDPNAFSRRGFQFAPPQPLVLPNSLDQPLGGELFIVQKILAAGAGAPLGVEIF
jgi:hypothetical protein